MKKILALAATVAFVCAVSNTNAEELPGLEPRLQAEYGLTELQPLPDSAASSVRGTGGVAPVPAQDFINTVLATAPSQRLQVQFDEGIVDSMLNLLKSLGPISSAPTPIGGSLSLGIDTDGRFRLINLTNGFVVPHTASR